MRSGAEQGLISKGGHRREDTTPLPEGGKLSVSNTRAEAASETKTEGNASPFDVGTNPIIGYVLLKRSLLRSPGLQSGIIPSPKTRFEWVELLAHLKYIG